MSSPIAEANIGYGGTGKQVRDVLHIDDLYNLLKIQMKNMEKYSGKTYNVGGGEQVSVSLKELTSICNQVTGKTIKISGVAETRKADIPYYVTDCSKVHLETGWKPHKSVKEIVKDIAEWIKNNEDTVKPILK
jgi:CDP-paratose 2-epimerase